jgi:predicted transcriptional regulator YdeE/catechol 2,3-dioxygenase-like lactoylglutathione lyase family enzyme
MSAIIDNKRPGVVLHVRDLKRTAEWYTEMLGFEIGPHDYNAFVEMFMGGEYIFHLSQASENTLPISVPMFWFHSNDIELAYSDLQSKGVQIGEMSWFPDYSAFTFHDIEGNAVSISQNFQIRFKELEAYKLVGIKVLLTQDSTNKTAISQAAHELKTRLIEIPNVIHPHQMIGVSKAGISSIDDASYWVCVQVKLFDDIPQGMATLTVPVQRYAAKWYYGSRNDLNKTYLSMQSLIQKAGHSLPTPTTRIEISNTWGDMEESEIELYIYEAVI